MVHRGFLLRVFVVARLGGAAVLGAPVFRSPTPRERNFEQQCEAQEQLNQNVENLVEV